MQITEIIEINAPVQTVWEEIAKLDQVQHYVTSVTRSQYSSEARTGIGAQRTCDVQGFGTLVETIVDWRDGERLAYTVDGMPSIIKNAKSEWRVRAKNPSQTTVTVTSTMETRYGVLGSVLERLALEPKVRETIRGAVQEFKAYVENQDLPRTLGVEAIESHVA